MTDPQSQPCPPITSVSSSCGEPDGGRNLKRKVEEPGEGGNSKLPRLAEDETREGEAGRFESRTESPDGAASVPASATELKPGDSADSRPSDGGPVGDVHRTGAKCVPGGPADPLRPGAAYHSTGVLRVKPGRGEPTLSLSCSDKLARWGVLGFQGALLSHYLEEALYFDTVVVGKCPYSQEVMHRALVTRCSHVSELPAGFSVRSPLLLQSSLEFQFSQNQTELRRQGGQGRISPCGAGQLSRQTPSLNTRNLDCFATVSAGAGLEPSAGVMLQISHSMSLPTATNTASPRKSWEPRKPGLGCASWSSSTRSCLSSPPPTLRLCPTLSGLESCTPTGTISGPPSRTSRPGCSCVCRPSLCGLAATETSSCSAERRLRSRRVFAGLGEKPALSRRGPSTPRRGHVLEQPPASGKLRSQAEDGRTRDKASLSTGCLLAQLLRGSGPTAGRPAPSRSVPLMSACGRFIFTSLELSENTAVTEPPAPVASLH